MQISIKELLEIRDGLFGKEDSITDPELLKFVGAAVAVLEILTEDHGLEKLRCIDKS